ncbi:C45 family peptidase [Enhydrobacter sp.]|jgi:isopenicillin-N N-acyltransferase-like protein|uniref:C45 family autoproteolytic acyltransferase/hydolase n=1 Tax=Enhydrobacter sp. TaxID=1894999 RepID=UPI00261120AA|nr:C45 family peptidase [Enhydrobacter sp.]WIM11114.1 MAG: acyl-coenzyme A:6-aminopenicillanic-acid-acyltransferase [Enhydrobacter sp.]
MDYAPFPLIELSGNAHERGLQHGRAVADRIKCGIAMYAESLVRNGVDWPELERRAEALLPTIEAFDAAYVEEMRGIARAADVPFAGIVLMNARTEMVVGARKAREPLLPDGCTAALALPEVTADGVLLHGQNWDWRAECAETGVLLRIRREDGPDILTFTEAGGLARSGLNSAGIGLTANALECDRDYQRGPGVPLPFIRRKVLESAFLAQAVRTVFATRKLGSNHMAVSHCGGEAFGLECAPDETFWLAPDRGLYVHANHWISDAARVKVKDTGLAETPCSIYRDRRVREQLSPDRGRLTLEHFRQAFFDDYASPWSVCRPPRPNNRGAMVATAAMILMRPGEGHLEACPMPALNRHFTSYRLTPDRTAQKQAAA